MKQHYRCWAEIDRTALRHNAGIVRERIGSAEMLAVVKANAYGHGLLGVAETLANDAQLFGVANVEEAIALQDASLPHPIIILGPAVPEERSTIIECGFIPTISSLDEAQKFNRTADDPHRRMRRLPLPNQGEPRSLQRGREDRSVPINFKIDTGMGRMGVVEDEAIETFKRVAALPKIVVNSISTHMPVSDTDPDYTRDQLNRFRRIVEQIRKEIPGNYKAHVLQSAGTLAFNDPTFEIVRAGIILHGISPLKEFQKILKPVMTWKTRIGLIRNVPKGHSISYGRTFISPQAMRVATLACGYADGYPRHLSNRDAAVLVGGRRCPLLGRVTMDLIVIDISHLKDVDVGDEVVLMGRQGNEEISAHELAEKAGTITWDITTRIGPRVKRVFVS